jgi:tetratricopeptide (TPR) repeat protein
MSANSKSALALAMVLVAANLGVKPAQGQATSTSVLAAQLETHYKLPKLAPDSNMTDAGTVFVIAQEKGPTASTQGLTNDDVIKLVQAKLPDSVILAKIKSSNSDFDTSPDALIKLKRAGVSDSLLQAIVEAMTPPNPSDSTENSPGAPPGNENDPAPACSDYDSCIRIAETLRESSKWDQALVDVQKAFSLEPTNPGAWAAIGRVYLASGRYAELPAVWDTALSLGGPLAFVVCHPHVGRSCQSDRSDRGDLSLGPKLVSFITSSGQKVFAISPSAVISAEVSHQGTPLGLNELRLKIGGKNHNFYFVPFGVDCGKEESAYCEEDEAVAQQLAVFNYVSRTIPRLASGALGSSPP